MRRGKTLQMRGASICSAHKKLAVVTAILCVQYVLAPLRHP